MRTAENRGARKHNPTKSAADHHRRPATLQNAKNQSYEVVVAAAPRFARENALLLSSAASPVLSISIEPLK